MASFRKREPAVLVDKEALVMAYDDVRSDNIDITWLVLKYMDENKIVLDWTGRDLDKFLVKCTDKCRLFGYVKVSYIDPQRTKFVFITWIGKNVDNELKQRVHGDRECVKTVIEDFACELFLYEEMELTEDVLRREINKAILRQHVRNMSKDTGLI